tara:strand:+ start:8982 stop:9806 length:825 start_codon:yes stop_codon:yes gene_type:complete
MYLFGLEGSGFIISLGLTLLISGAIMFYILKRFAVLENTLIDQSKILHSFINKMQQKENVSHLEQSQIANDIAIESANKQMSMNNKLDNYLQEGSNKIDVSDDESSNESNDESGNSQYSSEYDSDNELENNNDDNNYKKIIIQEDIENDIDNKKSILEIVNDDIKNDDSVKIISIEDIEPDINNNEKININNSDLESNPSLTTDSDNDNSDTEEKTEELYVYSNEDKITIKKGGITKMRVDELRTLVIEKGLVNSKDDASKLKKENLIKLLQNN